MLPVLFNIFITLLFYKLLKYVLYSNNRDKKQNNKKDRWFGTLCFWPINLQAGYERVLAKRSEVVTN